MNNNRSEAILNGKYYLLVESRVLNQINSKEYMDAYAGKEQSKTDKNHFLEIVRLVTELWAESEKQDMPVALKIAALCHDLDRIYPQREVNTKNCQKRDYETRKMIHSGNSAILFFEENPDLPKPLLHDVCYLILRHEVGGDRNAEGTMFDKPDEFTANYNLNVVADYLYYADKMSFFYSGIHEYKKRGKEKLKSKILFSLKGLPEKIIEKIRAVRFEDKFINECITDALRTIARNPRPL